MQQGWTDGRPGGGWRSRSARWPRSARLATVALVALIGLTLVGAALDQDRTDARPASTTATTARPIKSEVTTSPSTSQATASTVGSTTTTTLSTTITTAEAPTTSWAAPPPTDAPSLPAVPAGGFANCAAARAAGAAPVHVGEPGYAPRLDGDGDGIGCE